MTTHVHNITQKLLVTGRVQGVGFRPFVYRSAHALGLQGSVRNTSGGVEILVSGSAAALTAFVRAIREEAPDPSIVNDIVILDAAENDTLPDKFTILASDDRGEKTLTVMPDFATCPECLAEMRDPANRRYRYPFINCTACGPRYSIMHRLPYDRERTTMRTFSLCPECLAEYNDPESRRFHAQPNACPVCGPKVSLWDRRGRAITSENNAIEEAAQCIRNGGILAVKGIGGFHLLADAANDRAVRTLRERKSRAEKPFAVMARNLESARRLARINRTEAAWLTSSAAPIVLFRRQRLRTSELADSVAPGLPWIGVFLPYSPLHHLIMDDLRRPIVATSGNISDEPICTDEHDALERLGGIADFFLVHNRPIAHPVDDSVIRIVLNRPQFIRRARGLSPLVINTRDSMGGNVLVGVGAHMKSTFALARDRRVVVGPHVGDLETIPAWESYEHNLETLNALYDSRPVRAACDSHPDYASTRYAHRHFVHTDAIQHHHAHIASVMLEHGLSGPVLGFAWDGTGYGSDGTIWGGEILRVDKAGYTRLAHLRSFPLPGGDVAAREPRRSALGVVYELGLDPAKVFEQSRPEYPFSAREIAILTAGIQKRINTAFTTSAGRLFDAAASLLGIIHVSSYEGHAAMLLQAAAESVDGDGAAYPFEFSGGVLDWEPMFREMIRDNAAGLEAGVIAARFHQSFVNMIAAVSTQHPDLPVVLGGGCFQNGWILERTVRTLKAMKRDVYWPDQLPPNDGGICVGQIAVAGWRAS